MSKTHRVGEPSQDDYRFVVYLSRGKLAVFTLASAAFVAIGVWMCSTVLAGQSDSDSHPPGLVFVFGALAIVFFGVALLFGVVRLVSPKPAVIVDSTGVHDHASFTSVGFIPWNEIQLAVATSVGRQRNLSIELKNPETVVERASGLKRLALRANMKMQGTPVHIPQILLPLRVTELESEIDRTLWGESADGSHLP